MFKAMILALIVVPATFGQTNNFEFVQYDTAYVGNEDFIVLHGDIFNLTDADRVLTVTKVEHFTPDAWSSTFCWGRHCLPSWLESDTDTLFAGDTALFTLDTFPFDTPGVGSWTYYAVDSSTMEVDSAHFSLEVTTVSIDKIFERPTSFELSNLYPNPTNATINFYLNLTLTGNYSVTLYTLDGREVMTRSYELTSGRNQLQWGLQGLPSGNYIIRAKGAGESISRQVSVIK